MRSTCGCDACVDSASDSQVGRIQVSLPVECGSGMVAQRQPGTGQERDKRVIIYRFDHKGDVALDNAHSVGLRITNAL